MYGRNDCLDLNDVTAVLLCGGRGERLRPLTRELPKPLIPISGKPILEHILDHLCLAGVTRYVLCVGYKADAIRRFVEGYSPPGCQFECIDSGEVSMTDRILDAARVSNGPILICYGDTLADVDLLALEKAQCAAGTLATLTVYPVRSQFGIVEIGEHDRVARLVEKPVLPCWMNIGFLRCDSLALRYMRRNSDLIEFCSTLSAIGELSAYRHQGRHITVNTEVELVEAERIMESYAAEVNG